MARVRGRVAAGADADATPPAACGYESPEDDSSPPEPPFRRQDSDTDPESAARAFESPSSLTGMINKANGMTRGRKVSILDRIACFQWTWFTMTMVNSPFAP